MLKPLFPASAYKPHNHFFLLFSFYGVGFVFFFLPFLVLSRNGLRTCKPTQIARPFGNSLRVCTTTHVLAGPFFSVFGPLRQLRLMAATKTRDVLRRPAPRWAGQAASLLSVSTGSKDAVQLFFTAAQRRQLSGLLFFPRRDDDALRVLENWPRTSDTLLTAAQAVLTHGRFFRLVNPNRGDVVLHVDTCDFLSCEGAALTSLPHEIAMLEERTRTRSLLLPFWVSERQARELCAYQQMQRRFRCASSDSATMADVFQNNNVFLELTCGTPEVVRYVNWEALCSGVISSTTLLMTLSFFRCFSPINVRTRRRFDFAVEVRLRVEAMSSECWCSIWGTAKDYEQCGFKVLEGALGVDVFDELGNPAFLIHALCTTTPLEVYAACYPNDSICASSSM